MRKQLFFFKVIVVLLTVPLTAATTVAADAPDVLRYSCSAQVFEAFGGQTIEAFERETGIEIDVRVSSSRSAVQRLLTGFSDIASTTRPIYSHYGDYGYEQIPICKDALAVIVNDSCPIKNITSEQIREIFSKETDNWNALGGPDQKIVIVVPGNRTGAFENFDRQLMPRHQLQYDFLAHRSTDAIAAVSHFPWSISFIGYGAVKGQDNVRILTVDGIAPDAKNYPYYQVYSYVSQGNRSKAAQKFIDFALSGKGRDIIVKRGMKPVSE